MPSQGILSVSLVVLLLMVVLATLFWAYRQTKKRQNEVEALGFQRWPDIDSHFIKSVCSLAAYPYPERLDVETAYLRSLPDMLLVNYDLLVKFGGEPGRQRHKFAVYRAEVHFPIIRLIPRPEEFGQGAAGRSGKFAVKNLLQFALKRSKEVRLDFSTQPEFDRRFDVTAKDEDAARSILTAERITQLTHLPKGVMLQLGGGVILVEKPGVIVERRYFPQHLAEMTDLAIQAGQIFSDN